STSPDLSLHSFPTRRSSDLISLTCFERTLSPSAPFTIGTSSEFSHARHGCVCCAMPDSNPEPWPIPGAAKCSSAKALSLRERARSEEHTSELQSLAYLVCRL